MKTTFLLVSILCMTVAGCIGDPTIDTDEAEVLVDEPDAGEANIITPGCDGPETDPYRVCEGNGGGGSGTGGGGGGSGGGTCTPGAPGCPGPIQCTPPWREGWVNGTRRCVHPRFGETCTGSVSNPRPPGTTCVISADGQCVCPSGPNP